jgi:hypothetical protein
MYNQLNISGPALIELIKNRKKAGAEELFDQYAKVLSLVIFRIVGDSARMEDLLEQTIVRIWLTIDQYNEQETTFLAWMIAVAKNIADELQETEVVKFKPLEILPGDVSFNLSI